MNAHNKPIFDGLLHTGKPDLEALYRVGKIPMVIRTNVFGWQTSWADPLGLPSAAWYDAMVSGTQALAASFYSITSPGRMGRRLNDKRQRRSMSRSIRRSRPANQGGASAGMATLCGKSFIRRWLGLGILITKSGRRGTPI